MTALRIFALAMAFAAMGIAAFKVALITGVVCRLRRGHVPAIFLADHRSGLDLARCVRCDELLTDEILDERSVIDGLTRSLTNRSSRSTFGGIETP